MYDRRGCKECASVLGDEERVIIIVCGCLGVRMRKEYVCGCDGGGECFTISSCSVLQ